jgi:hypothetical protein
MKSKVYLVSDEEFIEIVKKCATMAQAAKMCRNGF